MMDVLRFRSVSGVRAVVFVVVLALLLSIPATAAEAERLTFRRALELALARSPGMGIAVADQVRARQGYEEARNTYIPQLVVGSGAAKSWGFPLSIEGSAPSIFQVNSQSFLINPAQREFVRAARTDWLASKLSVDDQRQLTIVDTAVTFMQLDNALSKLKVLEEEGAQAQRAEQITRDRVQEGIDSKLDLTKASLNAARVRVRLTDAQANVDLLRQHMAQLTGLNADGLQIEGESFPRMPQINPQDDAVGKAVANSPVVKAAEEKARAREQRARGEHKQLYPAVDFVGQYGLFSKYNNYDEFFRKFQRNNATVGVSVRFPFMNYSQKAHAEAADAEALRARREADAAKNQISADTLKLQRAVQQLAAARDVAQLEYEVALAGVDAVQAKIEAGNGTIRDQENARMEVNDRYAALVDAGVELDKARLQLMRATGELEKWAMP